MFTAVADSSWEHVQVNHMDTNSKDKNMIHKVLLNPVNSKDSFNFLALETVDFLHNVQWIIYRNLAVQFISVALMCSYMGLLIYTHKH